MLLTEGATPFEVVLGDLTPSGYRLACGMLHDAAAAEDAVQEAALKAWRKRAHLRPGADPLPWFLAIVANECRSMTRRRWWSVLRTESLDPAVAPEEDRVVRRADLRQAILRLSPRDRLVVILFFYLDLPLEEVARIAGLSVGAARARLYRSVKKLRPGLEFEEALR
jgi:RNA polymerase sigma-70 factor (ECF subfamily)